MTTSEPDNSIAPAQSSPEMPPGDADGDTSATGEVGTRHHFGIGTLLTITAMYAVLLAGLRAMGTPPIAFVEIGLYFTIVGLAQTFLFKGRRPGDASLIAGAGISVCAWVFAAVAHSVFRLQVPVPSLGRLVEGAILGALFGYLFGLLIRAAFALAAALSIGRAKSPRR